MLFVWGLVFDYFGFVLYCNYCLLVLQVLVVGVCLLLSLFGGLVC